MTAVRATSERAQRLFCDGSEREEEGDGGERFLTALPGLVTQKEGEGGW